MNNVWDQIQLLHGMYDEAIKKSPPTAGLMTMTHMALLHQRSMVGFRKYNPEKFAKYLTNSITKKNSKAIKIERKMEEAIAKGSRFKLNRYNKKYVRLISTVNAFEQTRNYVEKTMGKAAIKDENGEPIKKDGKIVYETNRYFHMPYTSPKLDVTFRTKVPFEDLNMDLSNISVEDDGINHEELRKRGKEDLNNHKGQVAMNDDLRSIEEGLNHFHDNVLFEEKEKDLREEPRIAEVPKPPKKSIEEKTSDMNAAFLSKMNDRFLKAKTAVEDEKSKQQQLRDEQVRLVNQIHAIESLSQRITSLEEEVTTLKQQNQALSQSVSELRSYMVSLAEGKTTNVENKLEQAQEKPREEMSSFVPSPTVASNTIDLEQMLGERNVAHVSNTEDLDQMLKEDAIPLSKVEAYNFGGMMHANPSLSGETVTQEERMLQGNQQKEQAKAPSSQGRRK